MTAKRNILFVTCWYPKNGSSEGIFVSRHAEALNKSGHSITVFVMRIRTGSGLFRKKITKSRSDEGIEVVECEVNSKAWKFIYTIYPLLRFVFRKEIRSFTKNFDIVQSNVFHPASIIGHSIAKQMKTPHVIMEHHSKLPYYMDHVVFKWGVKRVYRKAAAVMFVSDFLRSLVTTKLKHDRTFIVPNVVDSETFKNSATHVREEGKVRVLAVANWKTTGKYVVKRPDLILHALASLKERFEIEMEFVGPGDLDSLKNESKNHGLKCLFSGEKDVAYINSRLNEVDYFFHASEIETFSMVVVEALCVGVPVLASKVGAIPEHIHSKNGILVANTKEAWIAGVNELVGRNYSRQEISDEIKERYSSKVVANKLNDVYTAVLN